MKTIKIVALFAFFMAPVVSQTVFAFDQPGSCHEVACNEVGQYESVYPDATERELELVYNIAYYFCANE